jgi:hypothetical protein
MSHRDTLRRGERDVSYHALWKFALCAEYRAA